MKTEIKQDSKRTKGLLNTLGWLFGMYIFAHGVLNILVGNDRDFGIGLLLLSFIYFPPVNAFIKRKLGFLIPNIAKIIIGLLVIWVTLAVGAYAEGYMSDLIETINNF
ncbi:hypothetical protein OOZ15_10505 [Galbibacter sp. EGI 63066]|uniref:hypothetical protein n=1 Tax=Galbibacter sp. EGI 63066 TaxID=2993559 RepID=UPI002248C2B8|nr:hypothetical protein [Galbibacter sp. EGI 63066]MCX2680372.1 hypothetical protein [Galbibacter sp. EGI 63066]